MADERREHHRQVFLEFMEEKSQKRITQLFLMKILQKLSNISKVQIQNGLTPNLWEENSEQWVPTARLPSSGIERSSLCVNDKSCKFYQF